MDQLGGPQSPTLPMPIVAAVVGVSALIILFALLRAKSRAGGFVIVAAWLRFATSAFPMIANQPVAAGLSANAMGAALSFVVGCLCISPRLFMLRFLAPFYVLMALAVVSALVNGSVDGLVLVLVKYGFLVVITLGVYEAMRRQPDGRLMRLLLWSFFAPLALQAISIAMGVAKSTENDLLAASFIGGYYHEATFSVMLACCVVAAVFAPRMNKYFKTALVLACVVGIYLANYRTTILAVAPLLIVYFGFSSVQSFTKKDRPLIASGAIIFCSIVLGVVSLFLASRFADIGVALSSETTLIKPPSQYTVDESRILSGRPMIWMGYIYGWLDGDALRYFFGFGPESWSRSFRVYAHNTLVNHLYEYGLFGLLAIIWVWFSMLVAAMRVRHPDKGRLVAAHISFALLNMGTMPMWMIEGNLLYGIICGYTLYCLSAPQEPAPLAPAKRRRGRGQRPLQKAPPAPAGGEPSLRASPGLDGTP